MEMSELVTLLSHEALELIDEVGPIASSDDALKAVTRMRAAGHSPDLTSAVVTQARLRTRAQAKFGPFAARMLFTQAGLEQATRMPVAARHARRFVAAGIESVADLGCGIGADSLAFAGAGLRVLAVDADAVTAGITAHNLAPFGDMAEVRNSFAEDVALEGIDAAWLDPARRTKGHSETKRVTAADYSPHLDWVFGLADQLPIGVKLGPAHDRDALPADTETQWVSVDGDVVELVVWTGRLARPGVRRAALVVRGDQAHELTAPADAPDEEPRELGAFLHEPDGAVIRARLVGEVARSLQAGPVADGIAYLTSDAALTTPFVSSFRVREVFAADVKTLAKALRGLDIGTLEIKKRGMDIDPAVFRKKLNLKGSQSATLILTRAGTKRVAILADRV